MLTPFERMLTYYAAQEVSCVVRFDSTTGYYRTVEENEVWAPTENSAQAFELAVDLGMEVQPPRLDGYGRGRVRYRQIVKTAPGDRVDDRQVMRRLIVEAAAQQLAEQTVAYQEGARSVSRVGTSCNYQLDSVDRALWTHGYHNKVGKMA